MANKTNIALLEHFTGPAFCAKDGIVTQVNEAAARLFLEPGTDVKPLIHAGKPEYAAFTSGCLYLTLALQGQLYNASVTREDSVDIFISQQADSDPALRAYALAARELREPLASIMTTVDRLFPTVSEESNTLQQKQMSYINQGLYQLLRIVGNMSDAVRYHGGTDFHPETQDILSLLREIIDQIRANWNDSLPALHFNCPEGVVYCPVDRQMMERAVFNLISNALKFTPAHGDVTVSVKKAGKRLYITVSDTGSGIPGSLHGTLYSRYQRSAGLEEANYGIGLGFVLVRAAAAAHGGTVLLESISSGSRVTMTLSLESKETTVSSPVLRVDYTGERNHCLVELSQNLTPDSYTPDKIN